MSDEAFPNAERLFKEAFASDQPSAPLLRLLKQHPTYAAVKDMVVTYTDVVETKPADGPRLAAALSQLAHLSDPPQITGASDPLGAIINRELADLHFKWIGYNEGPHTWGPENQYILESYLSGLSLKHGLTSTSDMLASVDDGLDATREWQHVQEKVVGACVQLLVAGSFFTSEQAGSYQKTADEIATKLKKQRDLGLVKEPNGHKVLEVQCFLLSES